MKKLLPLLPLVVFLAASCSKNKAVAETLPPVVKKAPAKVASKPKTTKKKTTRTYRKSTPSKSKPKPKTTYKPKPVVVKKATPVDPLIPDPVNVTQVAEIPRFEVPENIQPKMSDGINQAEFLELKW